MIYSNTSVVLYVDWDVYRQGVGVKDAVYGTLCIMMETVVLSGIKSLC